MEAKTSTEQSRKSGRWLPLCLAKIICWLWRASITSSQANSTKSMRQSRIGSARSFGFAIDSGYLRHVYGLDEKLAELLHGCRSHAGQPRVGLGMLHA